MRTPFTLLALVAAAMLLAVGCTSNPATVAPKLPPGFQEAKLPKGDLAVYAYVNQGAPVAVPLKWFGGAADDVSLKPGAPSALGVVGLQAWMGPTADLSGGSVAFTDQASAQAAEQLAVSQPGLAAVRNDSQLGLVYGAGDWAVGMKAALQSEERVTFTNAYPQAWELLQMLPKQPPTQPVAAGFARVEGGMLEEASRRLGLGLEGVTQALGSLNVTGLAFVAYSQKPLDAPQKVGMDYFRQHGMGALVAVRSSYPAFLLSFFLDNFAGQAGLQKGTQVSGRDVLTRDLGDAHLVAVSIGSVLFLAMAPEEAAAEALINAVLEQQG